MNIVYNLYYLMKYCITYYVHEESGLPKKGWLQSCIMCYTITSKTLFFSQIEKHNAIIETQVHLCPICKRKLNPSSSSSQSWSSTTRAFQYEYLQKVNEKINDYVIPTTSSLTSTPTSSLTSTPTSSPTSTPTSSPTSTPTSSSSPTPTK